jgi:hypothetical protein
LSERKGRDRLRSRVLLGAWPGCRMKKLRKTAADATPDAQAQALTDHIKMP